MARSPLRSGIQGQGQRPNRKAQQPVLFNLSSACLRGTLWQFSATYPIRWFSESLPNLFKTVHRLKAAVDVFEWRNWQETWPESRPTWRSGNLPKLQRGGGLILGYFRWPMGLLETGLLARRIGYIAMLVSLSLSLCVCVCVCSLSCTDIVCVWYGYLKRERVVCMHFKN